MRLSSSSEGSESDKSVSSLNPIKIAFSPCWYNSASKSAFVDVHFNKPISHSEIDFLSSLFSMIFSSQK